MYLCNRYKTVFQLINGGMNMAAKTTDYLASQLQGELDRLWADGTLNNKKVESFRTLRERTLYNKTAVP